MAWKLTDEARAQIPEWNARWERLILSTDPIDFERTSRAVIGMYRAANLPTDDLRIVRVASPMMAAIVGCCAAVYWRRVGLGQTTDAATRAATHAATDVATHAATDAATRAATHAATDAATRAATRAATLSATHAATRAATLDEDDGVMFLAAVAVVSRKLGVDVRDECRKELGEWCRYYNGGNEWAAWCAYLSFVRDVVGWSHESHANYAHYEEAAIYGGPRFMHTHCVLLADRALRREVVRRRGVWTLHCESGPAVEWKCGTKLWRLEGLAVDEQIVLRPETQTIEQIEGESNADVRAVRLERFGVDRYLRAVGAEPIDTWRNEVENTRVALVRTRRGEVYYMATCPSGRHCPPLRVPRGIATCETAYKWLLGDTPKRVIART